MRRWLPWAALALVLLGALAVGAREPAGPPTESQRVHRLASKLRCPTCRSQSVADSNSAAARAMRDEIRRRVRAGETDGEILAFMLSRYGPDVLLDPEGRGIGALVWALPVAAVVCAAAGLVVAFRRWRPRPGGREGVSDEDRALVERALGS